MSENEKSETEREDRAVGLCATCCHGRRVASSRGAAFWLCGKSATDPAFPKYPRLPVLDCAGYRLPDS